MLKAVTYILENDATLQSLIGSNKSGSKHKVYPVVVPETEKAPYCVCRIVSKERTAKNCGYIWSIEVTSYATSYDTVTDINDAVISALEGAASGTVNGENYGWSNFSTESDQFDKDHDLYAKISTFDVYGI